MICDYPIEQLLPHAHPMILLSEFVAADEHSVSCRVKVAVNSPFFDHERNGVPAYVGLEYMAQAVAAYSGAQHIEKNEAVRLGFLLGSRKYQPTVSLFAKDVELTVRADKVVADETGLSVFDCRIYQQEKLLVQAKLNVFEPKDHQQWLRERK